MIEMRISLSKEKSINSNTNSNHNHNVWLDPEIVGSKKDHLAGILLRGHCNNELWGLASHPLLPE